MAKPNINVRRAEPTQQPVGFPRRTGLLTLTVALLILAIIRPAIAQPQPAAAATDNPWTGMDRLPDNRPAA